MKQQKTRWGLIIGLLIVLFILANLIAGAFSLFSGSAALQSGNVAVVPIKGIILTSASGTFLEPGVASSSDIVDTLEEVADDPSIQAIILEIDSPGGAPVASDEIATAVKRTNKTTVAWIREVGASGAYWIASASDHIIANRLSITGSIGVLGSYLDFSGLLERYNVSYEEMNGGQYKDLGTPFRKLTSEERRLLQKKIDLMHQVFKDEVQKNRKLTNAEMASVGTGEFFLGMEAMNLGLVDEMGGEKEALAYIEKKLNITAEPVSYEEEPSFLDLLAQLKAPQKLMVDFSSARYK